jgi:hypothetical protein
MAFTIGTATFTNGSTAVTNVSLSSGTLAYFASGTRMVVGANPVTAEVEAISAPSVTSIELRTAWPHTGGTYAFLANQTSEGLRDAVQAIRTSNSTVQEFIDSISVQPTNNSVVQRTANGRVKTQPATEADDALRLGQLGDLAVTLTGNQTVAGVKTFTSDSSFNEVLVGRGSGNVAGNTTVGLNALQNNTTGSLNTAMGFNALRNNTTGNNNNAVGVNSLQNNTTGNDNTALGAAALRFNTEGNQNTALGRSALQGNTTGNENTAVGFNALTSNTTGSSNTTHGFNSLRENTTGDDNTAVGVGALRFNTTGSNSTAMGRGALENNTAGGSNTAVGREALEDNTTGFGNTAVGREALQDNTTGISNTAIGRSALQNNTTGSGNTAISPRNSTADYAPVFNITTQNNRIAMGSTAVTNAYIQVAWTVVSDERDKTDFAAVPHGLDFVCKLKPTAYRYKMNREDTEGHGPIRYGFKAGDVLKEEGENPVIVDADDPDKLRFNDQSLIAVLVNAIQELNAKVEALKGK